MGRWADVLPRFLQLMAGHPDVEQRLHRIEDRSDQTMIGMLVVCTGSGFFLGALTGSVWPAVGYGLVGALIGFPAGFVVNVSRRLFG
jgi:hypothetical protein